MTDEVKITRAEAEAKVRDIKRWCRGLPAIPEFAERERLFNAYKAAEAARDWDKALEITMCTETAIGIVGQQVDLGDWEKLNIRFHSAVFAHGDQVGKPCGADFNDIICSNPFDGKQYQYKCPNCGQQGQYGAPYFDLVETPTEAEA